MRPGNELKKLMYNDQIAISTKYTSFYAKVMFYFGLALLSSAYGTFVGFNYIAPLFFAAPALVWVAIFLELALVLTSRWWSTKRPYNYMLFVLLTFITGVIIFPLIAGVVYQFGGPDIIIKALIATTLTFSGTALFGWTTKYDLEGLKGLLAVTLLGMLIIAIIGAFVPWGSTFEMFFSGVGVVLFGAYTMYDIQQLKRHPKDRPLEAALNLYLDIFNLFIHVLRIISATKD